MRQKPCSQVGNRPFVVTLGRAFRRLVVFVLLWMSLGSRQAREFGMKGVLAVTGSVGVSMGVVFATRVGTSAEPSGWASDGP